MINILNVHSDYVQERKIMESGPANWQNFCFVPTNSDAFVGGFRRWLKKYIGGQVDWGGKFPATLSPPLPREQLMDRYYDNQCFNSKLLIEFISCE